MVAVRSIQRVSACPAGGPTVPLRTQVRGRLGWLGVALTVGHVVHARRCQLRRKLPERLLGKLFLFTCNNQNSRKTSEPEPGNQNRAVMV